MKLFGKNKKFQRDNFVTKEALEKAEKMAGGKAGDLPGTPGLIYKLKDK